MMMFRIMFQTMAGKVYYMYQDPRKTGRPRSMMARAAALAALAVASEAFMPPVIPGFCHHSQPARIVCAFMARVIRALCFVSR